MKLLLLACFFSPLLTMGAIYWTTSGGNLEPMIQPSILSALLFWVWHSAGSRLGK
jgi:lipopolysaccharide export LptBFGC system permease protein LptF